MRESAPGLLLLKVLVAAVLSQQVLGNGWITEHRQVRPTDSVRIRAVPSMSTIAWGAGTASDPVGLRAVEYHHATKKPYEWFLKFNLEPFVGKYVESATLSVSWKCAASADCMAKCKAASKCTCATIFNIVSPNCGGGNLDEPYDAGSDDLHVWHVSNGWDNHWKLTDWSQTFDGTTRAGVRECCNRGSGGASKLSFANYLSGKAVVGETGTAHLNVVNAMGPRDLSVGGERYKVGGGYISLRLAVNGTSSRFFVPEGGDSLYTPVLKLVVGYPASTTGSPGQQQAQQQAPLSTTSTTTITTTIATTTTTTNTASVTTTTNTASVTTTASGLLGGQTLTTGSVVTTTTNAASVTIVGKSATPTQTATIVSTTTVANALNGTTTSTSGARTTTTSQMAVAMDLSITQVFNLDLSEAADPAAAVSSMSFQQSCQTSAAFAMGRDVKDIKVISAALGGVRRLAANATAPSSQVSNIIFRYRITEGSLGEMHKTIATVQNVTFGRVFGQQLISAERALPKGLQISWFSLMRTSTSSLVHHNSSDQSPNRTAQGGILDIFCSPDYGGTAALQAWAESAAPAIQEALKKHLSAVTPSIAASELVVFVTSGPVSVSSSQGQARFSVFAAVPPLAHISDDPYGRLYQSRSQNYTTKIADLQSSTEFAVFLGAELDSDGMPSLPGMSFYPSSYASKSGYEGAAASGGVIAIILGVASIVALVCCCFVRRWQRSERPWRLRTCLCPCCHRKQTFQEEPGTLEEGTISCERGQQSTPVKELRTATTLEAAMKEFDEPESPGTSLSPGRLASMGSDFFNMLDSNSLGSFNVLGQMRGAAKVKKLHKLGGTSYGKDTTNDQIKANTLRLAMGGCSKSIHHVGNSKGLVSPGSTKASGSTSASMPSGSFTQETIHTETPSSRRMIRSFKNYSSVDADSPDTRRSGQLDATTVPTSPSDLDTSSSSPSSDSELEVIEITDSSSDDDEQPHIGR